jgi:hypothetical protein
MDKIIYSAFGAALLILVSIAGYIGAMTITNAGHVAEIETHLTYDDHRIETLEADIRNRWRPH